LSAAPDRAEGADHAMLASVADAPAIRTPYVRFLIALLADFLIPLAR